MRTSANTAATHRSARVTESAAREPGCGGQRMRARRHETRRGVYTGQRPPPLGAEAALADLTPAAECGRHGSLAEERAGAPAALLEQAVRPVVLGAAQRGEHGRARIATGQLVQIDEDVAGDAATRVAGAS